MKQFPVTIIEKILDDPELSIQDVLNFAYTCRYLYKLVVNNSAIWKSKFFQKWPQCAGPFSKDLYTCDSYFEEFRYVKDLKKRTRALLATMPPRFYKKEDLSDIDLQEWATLLNESERTYHYLVFELREILNTNIDINSIDVVPFDTPGNNTMKYYAAKVLSYVQHLHLTKLWTAYIDLPPEKQILERGAVFVAQWSQPEIEISYNSMAKKLDTYANLVRLRLHQKNPSHSLFKVSKKDLELWKMEKLASNQFEGHEFHEIFEILSKVIYTELGFSTHRRGTHNDNNIFNHQTLLINKAIELKEAHYKILLIIYESVARRLGLIFEPIIFLEYSEYPSLRFKENNNASAFWYEFNVFDGSFERFNEDLPVATTQQVMQCALMSQEYFILEKIRTNENITKLRSIRELQKLVSPQDLENLERLGKFYMSRKINSRSLENHLMTQTFNIPEKAQTILQMLRNFSEHLEQNEVESINSIEAIPRDDTTRYAIGMVMSSSYHKYKCVITGWDLINLCSPQCLTYTRTYTRFERCMLMDYEEPFYQVVLEDGTQKYISQNDLTPSAEAGSLPSIQDLGRYFSHFFENHFVPNAEMEKEYPADTQVRQRFLHEM